MTLTLIRQTTKKYCSSAIIISIVIGIGLIIFGFKPMGKGLILGTIFSIINFILIGKTIPIRVERGKKDRFLLAIGSIGFRYALLAIPLILAIKMLRFDIFATICGIFMIQFVIMLDHLLVRRIS